MPNIFEDDSDIELLVQLRIRNYTAFTKIYKKYWTVIYAHVYRILKDNEDTRDIVQETFIQLWQKAPQINENVNLGGYIYLIAKNKVIDTISRKKVQRKYLQSLATYIDLHSNEILDKVSDKELYLAMENEIKNLPPKMRQIFKMRLKGNYTYSEIAQQLKISDKTVKKQVSNAIKILHPKMRHMSGWVVLLYLLK